MIEAQGFSILAMRSQKVVGSSVGSLISQLRSRQRFRNRALRLSRRLQRWCRSEVISATAFVASSEICSSGLLLDDAPLFHYWINGRVAWLAEYTAEPRRNLRRITTPNITTKAAVAP